MTGIAGSIRDRETNRARLLQAGLEVLAEHYTTADQRAPVLPITVSEVLERTDSFGGRPVARLTTGAVKHAFGDRAAFLEAIAQEMICVEAVLGDFYRFVNDLLLSASDDPRELRRQIALHDIANMTGSLAVTRHWFAAHSEASNSAIADQLRRVYEGFDGLMVPLLAKLGAREGRQPLPGLGWEHVANALTAWTEGTALRYHYSPDGVRETPWQNLEELEHLFLAGAESLWLGLTISTTASS